MEKDLINEFMASVKKLKAQIEKADFKNTLCIDEYRTIEVTVNGHAHTISGKIIEIHSSGYNSKSQYCIYSFYVDNNRADYYESYDYDYIIDKIAKDIVKPKTKHDTAINTRAELIKEIESQIFDNSGKGLCEDAFWEASYDLGYDVVEITVNGRHHTISGVNGTIDNTNCDGLYADGYTDTIYNNFSDVCQAIADIELKEIMGLTSNNSENDIIKTTIKLTPAEIIAFTSLIIEEKRANPDRNNKTLEDSIESMCQTFEITLELQELIRYRNMLENKLMRTDLTTDYRNAAFDLNAEINNAIIDLLFVHY